MSGKPKSTAVAEGRLLVEHCPRGRTRLRREMIPALLSYLMIRARRWERVRDTLSKRTDRETLPGGTESYMHAQWAVRVIQDIARTLESGFSRREWCETMRDVAAQMGLGLDDHDNPDSEFYTPPIPGME